MESIFLTQLLVTCSSVYLSTVIFVVEESFLPKQSFIIFRQHFRAMGEISFWRPEQVYQLSVGFLLVCWSNIFRFNIDFTLH